MTCTICKGGPFLLEAHTKRMARTHIAQHFQAHKQDKPPVEVIHKLPYHEFGTARLRQLAGERKIPNHRRLPREELIRALEFTDRLPS